MEETDKEFYLTGDLTEREIKLLDRILNIPDEKLTKYAYRIQETARLRGKESVDIVLRKSQIKPMLMSLITKRYFIGDKPGLGKTVMSASCYANYMYTMLRKNKTPKKILVVTTSSHVLGFAREWASYGIDLLPLTDGSTKIEKTMRKNNVDEFDGVILNWDGLKTNGFLDYYLRHADDYGFAVMDETRSLTSTKSTTYRVVNNILNKYRGGIPRVLFLNGTSFDKGIFEFYNQMNVLYPKLIPNKRFLDDNYVIRGGTPVHLLRLGNVGNKQRHVMQKNLGSIIDYKNLGELKKRLQYFYIARSKKDFSNDIPKSIHKLHGIEMTAGQKKILKETRSVVALNSPSTQDEKKELTVQNSPKLAELLDFVATVTDDRPLIYVYNKASQKTIYEELIKKGYTVSILNGDVDKEEKSKILDKFNSYKLDMLIINIHEALNIPTSDRILFYDIPTKPDTTTQMKGRIDRDNYKDTKFYDFFCYIDSQEMKNIIELAYFREKHGNAFTGQEEFTYHDLVDQLAHIYGKQVMDMIGEKVEEDEDFFDSDEWVEIIDDII